MSPKIALGSDHHGIVVRTKVADLLVSRNWTVIEIGPALSDGQPVDYPDIAGELSLLVSKGEAERGILICGTGIGMCIAANKFAGIRAATVIDELSAVLSRRHNDLNVLCLSGDMLSEETIMHLVDVWLETPFDGGRHEKRLEKIRKIEDELGMTT